LCPPSSDTPQLSLRGGHIVHSFSAVTHVADVTAPAPRAAWVRVISGSA
jgi:hypothetical protein